MDFTPSGWVTSDDGLRIAYYRWPATGDGARRPVVVLVHGYPDSARVWAPLVPFLRAHYDVVAYDVRGAGVSAAPRQRSAYRLAHLAGDLRAVIDQVSPDQPVHLVGHDWGSIQSWELVTEAAMASRLASFTSISGPCLDHMGFWLRRRLRPGRLSSVGRQLLRSWYIGAFHLPGLAPVLWRWGGRYWPNLLARSEQIQAPADPYQVRNGRNGIALYRANMLPRLLQPRPRLTQVPVLVLMPRDDSFVGGYLFDDLYEWVPNLRMEAVPGGHWLPLSRPQWLARRLDEFMQRSSRERVLAKAG